MADIAVYQLKLKEKDEHGHAYHTFLAHDVKKAIKNVEEERIGNIERVYLLACERDIYQVVRKLTLDLDNVFSDLVVLAEQGVNDCGANPYTYNLRCITESISERLQRINSLMSALQQIEDDRPWDFGYTEKEKSQA